MPERTRILHVGPMPPPVDGGIAAYLEGMLRSPLAQAWDLRTQDVRVAPRARRYRTTRALVTPVFVARISGALRRERPALVHIHASDFLGFWEKTLLGWVVRRTGPRVVMHLHGGSYDRFLTDLGPRQRQLARRALGCADRVIIPAHGWRPLLEQFVDPARLVVLPNAVHCDDFTPRGPTPAGPVRVLFVGMLSARKGIDELLQAVQQLLATNREFQLDIVGGEELHGELERYRGLYKAAGLDATVHFHGVQLGAAKARFYNQAEIFVLPSRHESFGIVNLEAMASGLAVVSTRTGAIPEYIEDGVHGLLVEPGDAAGLAAALGALLDDAALRARLGTAALRRVRDFDWQVIAARIGALYEAALATPRVK